MPSNSAAVLDAAPSSPVLGALSPELILATRNPGKVEELRALLRGRPLRTASADQLRLPEVVETGSTYQCNAVAKALAASLASGLPAIADDSGIEVDALAGQIGVQTARWVQEQGGDVYAARTLWREVTRPEAERCGRGATVVSALALAMPDGRCLVAQASLRGSLVSPPDRPERGLYGMFVPQGSAVDLNEIMRAELVGELVPRQTSHRGLAFQKLVDLGFDRLLSPSARPHPASAPVPVPVRIENDGRRTQTGSSQRVESATTASAGRRASTAGGVAKGAALVTGGAVRLGAEIVDRLAELGFDVAIHCHRSFEAAQKLAAQVRLRHGTNCVVVGRDLAAKELHAVILEASTRLASSLTVLVNNASVFESDSALAFDPDLFDHAMAVNVRSPLMLSNAFATQAPKGSLIVNMLDQRVLRPQPRHLSYTISKSSLYEATKLMAQAYAPDIRVNGVAPGLTLVNPTQDQAAYERRIMALPLHRGGSPSEVADAVAFLTTCPSVTGQVITVDGGQHLAWQTPDAVQN